MNDAIYLLSCLEAHRLPRRLLAAGITSCLTWECLQASAGGNVHDLF